jgi:hypothetical protein
MNNTQKLIYLHKLKNKPIRTDPKSVSHKSIQTLPKAYSIFNPQIIIYCYRKHLREKLKINPNLQNKHHKEITHMKIGN